MAFGHLAHRPAPDDPSIGVELLMNTFVMPAQNLWRNAGSCRRKAARMKTPVDGSAHMADDVGSHASSFSLFFKASTPVP
jgi:hypothetical protein